MARVQPGRQRKGERMRSVVRRIARRARDEARLVPWRLRRGPLLSIVIPVYNAEKYVEESVASLLGQYHRNIEIVLVDDGSTDRGPAIMSRSTCRAGPPGDADRAGERRSERGSQCRQCRVARGRYLTFVDSDDLVTAEGFARGVARWKHRFRLRHPALRAVAGTQDGAHVGMDRRPVLTCPSTASRSRTTPRCS